MTYTCANEALVTGTLTSSELKAVAHVMELEQESNKEMELLGQ